MIPAEKPASLTGAPRWPTASRALHFPVEATVPEHKRHLELRTLLYRVLGTLSGERDLVLTPEEAANRARETEVRAREAADRAREAADRAREAAEQRVAELEAQLHLRKG